MKTIVVLIAFVMIVAGCSRSSKDTYEEAKTAEQQKNFPTALEKYAQVVEKDGASAYAESSQYHIALIYNNELREVGNAAVAYRKFYSLFPNSKDAATCLFLSGFIYNNDLKMHDTAKAIYNEFMQKFPNHELVKSAQFELQTMGKDPVDFLKKDSIVQAGTQPPAEKENE